MNFLYLLASTYLLASCYAHKNHPTNSPPELRQPDWTSQRMMHGYSVISDYESQLKNIVGSAKYGKAIYSKNCAPCHGITGIGNGEHAMNLKSKPADLTKYPPWHQSKHFFVLISVGTKSGMPGWQDLLSQQQIADVLAYIRTL